MVESSLGELEFQAAIAELVGADVIVLHGGGAAGGVPAALGRLGRGSASGLSARARSASGARERRPAVHARRTCCRSASGSGSRWCTTSHHHRCKPDGLSVRRGHGAGRGDLGRTGAVLPHLVATGRMGRARPAAARGLHRSGGRAAGVAGHGDDGGCRGEGEGAGDRKTTEKRERESESVSGKRGLRGTTPAHVFSSPSLRDHQLQDHVFPH